MGSIRPRSGPDGSPHGREPTRRDDVATRLAYRLEGPPVEVRLPASMAAAAAALFPDGRMAPGSGPVEITVDDRPGGGFDVRTPAGGASLPDAAAALVHFELVLAEALLRRDAGVPLHAAGVLLPAGAVALVGEGGRGKSTLSAALARSGRPLYGDDILLLEGSTGRVRPFPRLLKLLPPAPELLGLPGAAGPLAEFWPASSLYHPSTLGSGWAEPAPIRAILFLERREAGPESDVEVVPMAPAEAARRLLPQLQLVTRAGAAEFEAVAAAVDGAETALLRYRSAPDAAGVLLRRYG